MTKANERQVAGSHYRDGEAHGLQHWDLAAMFGWDYFTGQVIKYLMRWKRKNGLEDLRKAAHYLQKYIEVEEEKALRAGTQPVPPDRMCDMVWHGPGDCTTAPPCDHEFKDTENGTKCTKCGIEVRVT